VSLAAERSYHDEPMRWRSVLAALCSLAPIGAGAGRDALCAEHVVDVVVAAQPSDAAALEPALREPLSRLGVSVRWSRASAVDPRDVVRPPPGARAAFARVWVDLEPGGRATLYLADAAWERILVRRLELSGGLDEVGREELAYVVRSSVEALLGGARIGLEREQVRAELGLAPAPAGRGASRPRAAPAGAPLVLALGALYEGQILASDPRASHGLGLAAGLARPGGLRPSAWLLLTYRFPYVVEDDRIGARLQTVSVRAVGTLSFALGERLSLRAGAGPGADLVFLEPRRPEGSDARLDPARWATVPLVRACVGPELRLGPGALLALTTGLDADLSETRYVAHGGGQIHPVFVPWRVRPFLAVELTTEVPARP
jgi:hypothetical protein